MLKKRILIMLVFVLTITNIQASANVSKDTVQVFSELARESYTDSEVQGAAIVMVSENSIEYLNYGDTDKNEVSERTLFELGSLSKSFTALAIYYLVQQGLVQLDEDIREYIPELEFDYSKVTNNESEQKEVTVQQLLCHTSGVAWISTVYIPEGSTEDMLEKTVLNGSPISLDTMPGERFCYTSLNYDILGLLIQRVSGMSYEDFMEQEIFQGLGLNHTYVYEVPDEGSEYLTAGYEYKFFQTTEADLPHFRGNGPAGYIISCCEDMARWLQIQMGLITLSDKLEKALQEEQAYCSTSLVSDNITYSSGWFRNEAENIFYHGGSNPGFSSMIEFSKEKGNGICILVNQSSNLGEYLATSYFQIIDGNSVDKFHNGGMKVCDAVCSVILILMGLLAVMYFISIIRRIKDIVTKKRCWKWQMKKRKILLLLFIYVVVCIFAFGIMNKSLWVALYIWMPKTLTFMIRAFLVVLVEKTISMFVKSNSPIVICNNE